jgi:diguanylate cyclase (GGDEF)-like protein
MNGGTDGERVQRPLLGASAGDERKLALITREACARTGAQTAFFAVLRGADRPLDVLSALGVAPWDSHLPSSLPADGFVGRVLESGHAAGEALGPEDALAMPTRGGRRRMNYAAAAVIRPPRGPLGLLCVCFRTPPPEMALTLWLMEGYARLAALALHDGEFLDALFAAATVDALTGCLNHAAIRSELDREVARGARHGRAVSCCFIDLDHFKRINDDRGHLHGSRVLAGVAAALREGLREEDGLGRYGGDEFLAILPETDEAGAQVLAERLRAKISSTTLDGRRVVIDASIGIARWRPGTTVDELLDAADKALLVAKHAGGATVVQAGNDRTPTFGFLRQGMTSTPIWGQYLKMNTRQT